MFAISLGKCVRAHQDAGTQLRPGPGPGLGTGIEAGTPKIVPLKQMRSAGKRLAQGQGFVLYVELL